MKFIWLLLVALSFSACEEIETPDGTLNDHFKKQYYNYTGLYTGGKLIAHTDVDLSIDGNKPVIKLISKYPQILFERCNSKIGGLKKIITDKKKEELKALVFSFDPGSCTDFFEGTELFVELGAGLNNVKIELSILHYVRKVTHCDDQRMNNPCFTTREPIYMTTRLD